MQMMGVMQLAVVGLFLFLVLVDLMKKVEQVVLVERVVLVDLVEWAELVVILIPPLLLRLF